MALPLGEAGIGEIPNESAVPGAIQSSVGDKTSIIFSRTRVAHYAAYRHSAGLGKLTNARVDIHVHVHGLI